MNWSEILVFAIISAAVFLVVVLGMAVGVLFGRRQLSGSCGGLANRRGPDGKTSCSLCENPEAACRELRDRGESGEQRQEGESRPHAPREEASSRGA